jgi:predicted nucleotidyltransferase
MFEGLIARIARELKTADLAYMIIGGQAVLLYGTPRMTKDIDITLGLDVGHLGNLLPVIGSVGLEIIPENSRSFVEQTSVLPTRETESGIRVDFIFSFTPYERQAISRSKAVSLSGTDVMFASAEDLIIHKIFAGRPRDHEDVRSILLKNPDLDIMYVRKWLREFEKSPEKKGLIKTFEELLAG